MQIADCVRPLYCNHNKTYWYSQSIIHHQRVIFKKTIGSEIHLIWIFALVLDDADVAWLMTPPVSELPSDVSIVAQHNELSANNENNDNTISRHHDNHISHQPGSVSVLLRDTPQ